MAEFDAHASIEDAIEEQAKGRVKKSADEVSSVEYHDIDDLIKADRYLAGKTAAGLNHFGIRMVKLVPLELVNVSSRHDQRIANHIEPALNREFGVEGVYFKRGDLVSDTFTARRRRRTHTAYGAALGFDVSNEQREYLLPIASVVVAGHTVKPHKGDKVVEGSETWELHFPDSATPVAQRHTDGVHWLCHVRRV